MFDLGVALESFAPQTYVRIDHISAITVRNIDHKTPAGCASASHWEICISLLNGKEIISNRHLKELTKEDARSAVKTLIEKIDVSTS